MMKRTDPTLDDVCRADRAGRISQCYVIEGDISPVRFLPPTFNGFSVLTAVWFYGIATTIYLPYRARPHARRISYS